MTAINQFTMDMTDKINYPECSIALKEKTRKQKLKIKTNNCYIQPRSQGVLPSHRLTFPISKRKEALGTRLCYIF